MNAREGDAGARWGVRLLGLAETRLVLASASPRRAEILAALGIPFEKRPTSVEERMLPGEAPRDAALRLAREKAASGSRPGGDALILGADTVVVVEGTVLGKPAGDEDARRMLRLLSGRGHEVVTALALLRERDGTVFADADVTRVRFRRLEDAEIEVLIASGEARDKAGGYGIQGLAALAVESIEGDFYNVVGLPLGCLRRLVREATRP